MLGVGMRSMRPCRGVVVAQSRMVSAKKLCNGRQGGRMDILVATAYLSTGANVGVCKDFKRVTGHSSAALNTKVAQYDTIVDMHLASRDLYSERPLFGTKVMNRKSCIPGLWKWTTYKEFGEAVDATRAAFFSKGIKPGDVVACISKNRKEWAEAAYATYSLGAIFAPMYEDQRPKDWQFIIKDSGAKLLLVSNRKIYKQTFHYPGVIGNLKDVISIDERGIEAKYTLPNLIRESHSDVPPINPHPDNVANIVYTSGTTGNPKGVVLTHRNTMATIYGIQERLPGILGGVDHTLSFLPWAHCYGQTCELHSCMLFGTSMAISQGIDKLSKELLEVRPTALLSVPAIYKRIFDGVHDKFQDGSPFNRYLFTKALQVGHHYQRHRTSGLKIGPLLGMQHAVLDKLVLSKIRAIFGGQLKTAIVGGAAIPHNIHTFFQNAGIPMIMGYGLTENTLVTLNGSDFKTRHVGCSGSSLYNVKTKIIVNGQEVSDGEEGEICVSGPSLMKGYHNNPAATKEVIFNYEGERYFRTGDLGSFNSLSGQRQLSITGRIKEQFKLENGKYVVPGPLEAGMMQSNYIVQTLLYGDNKPFCVSLIVPDCEKLRKWAIAKGHANEDTTREEILHNEYANNLIRCEIDTLLDGFKSYEKPRKFSLLAEAFTKEKGQLSQKMSIKRNVVIQEYSQVLQSMYIDEMRNNSRYDEDERYDEFDVNVSG